MTVAPLADMLRAAQRRAWHLEMLDFYGPDREPFTAWQQGVDYDRSEIDGVWAAHLAPLVARGGDLRRLRIVSEPVSQYIKWEHMITPQANIKSGERVRWLARRATLGLCLPTLDYWLVDDVAVFGVFDGHGDFIDNEVVPSTTNPELIEVCARSFEVAWRMGTDHADYVPR